MKTRIKATPLALAVAAAFALSATAAIAHDRDHHNRDGAHLSTSVNINKDIDVKGGVYIRGFVDPKSDTEAVINDGQSSVFNETKNIGNSNRASVDGNAANSAQGNIGLNAAAGDNNVQANEAALAATDAASVFGMATAQVYNSQSSFGNDTLNKGVSNNATLGGSALANAVGNIGVNVASGSSNLQKNALSGAVADSNVAIASINNDQKTAGNWTGNFGLQKTTTKEAAISLNIGLVGGYVGIADQKGNIYPDTWSGDRHTGGTQTGHIDLDSDVQGATDPLHDGGALTFTELGLIGLQGQATGTGPVTITTWQHVTNTASIGSNALMNAAGNVGANVAAGSNNLQSNILAVSAALNTGGATGGQE
jgi:hypothetical protein